MAYARRDIRGGAIPTTLASGITSGDTSFTLAASTGWPDGSAGDFFVVLDRGLAAEEKVRCASRSGTSVTVQTSGRGADGTSAAAHSSGAAAEHCVTAVDLDEANYTVTKTVGKVTTSGDLLVGDAANSLARLGVGTTGYPLVAGASTPAYAQLGTAGIADDAITAPKIAVDAVGAAEIAASAVGTTELADDSVTSAKIVAGTIATSDIADSAITSAKIADGTIVTADLADSSVTSAKIVDATIATGDLADSAVTSAKIADGTIVLADLAAAIRPITLATSAPGSPTAGDFWFDTDDYALKEYTTATTSWQAPWNLPWGMLASGQSTGTTNLVSGFTTETVVLTTSAVTVPANRKLKITAWCTGVSGGTGPLNWTIRIRRGTTIGGMLVGYMETALFDIAYPLCPTIVATDTGASGSTQYVITFAFSGASDASAPYYWAVEDVGPSANPS